MKAVKIVIFIWFICELLLWVREGLEFSILDTLPFVVRRGSLPGIYEAAAVAMLILGIWGYLRLKRR